MIRRYELTDEEWEKIAQLIPEKATGTQGRPAKDNRMMMNGMMWLARSGSSWRDLPERYGPWKSVYSRFRKWRDLGVFVKVFKMLSLESEIEILSLDSTTVKAHSFAAGAKKGAQALKLDEVEAD